MKKLLYFIGIIIPSLCCAQSQDAEIIPASNHKEHNTYYVDVTDVHSEENQSVQKKFGAFYVQDYIEVKKDLNASREKLWLWISFSFTSLGIIGLMIVFNKLKKNFNDTY